MSDKKPFYITTTLPYVNSDPHIGFALEIVCADVLARFVAAQGREVFFNTGTDEHGAKVFNKAKEEGEDPQAYVDTYAQAFKDLSSTLGLWEGMSFIRTTDVHHKLAAQEMWRRCKAKGDIYKKFYKIKYCVGCELEKTDSELADGACPLHPKMEIEVREEENYFFAFSKYQEKLLALYDSRQDFVIPHFRLHEIIVFMKEKGLEDFSISRLASKMSWGVPVPDDSDHVMYVWFDALVSYISTLGWPENEGDAYGDFQKFWPGLQMAGKDQVRQQAAMWQAMLMSAGIPASKSILIHGFINSGGQKMSKSVGNVIDPSNIVSEYGTDALRYFLLRECSFFEDSDFTVERFIQSYNTGLANGVGNLVSRIMKMATTNGVSYDAAEVSHELDTEITSAVEKYELNTAMNVIWKKMADMDLFIQTKEPFKLVKTDPEAAKKDIAYLLAGLGWVAHSLAPFLPDTSRKIRECLVANMMPAAPLFARKD